MNNDTRVTLPDGRTISAADYRCAMAHGHDAGNRSAAKHDLGFWTNDDKLAAMNAFNAYAAQVEAEAQS